MGQLSAHDIKWLLIYIFVLVVSVTRPRGAMAA
jgi:hypothetical protein